MQLSERIIVNNLPACKYMNGYSIVYWEYLLLLYAYELHES